MRSRRAKKVKIAGRIVLELREPIPPGVAKAKFPATLEGRIEAATARLESEARRI